MAFVALRGVHKDYQLGRTVVPAVRGVDVDIEAGEFCALVGPSGCGKSTLLNIVGCIDRPTTGSVTFDGREITTLSDAEEARHRLHTVGFVFQSFHLVPVLTVRENVEFPAVLAKVEARRRRRRVEKLLEAVQIPELANRRPDELSGGQRQRVAIARALINEPRLIIADEPTANLDSTTGEHIVALLRELNRSQGVTFLFATHSAELMQHATRIVRMRGGLIEAG